MAESDGRTPHGSKGRGERDPDHSCEFCSGPIAGSIFKTGMTVQRKPLLYADVGGLAIVEGDIAGVHTMYPKPPAQDPVGTFKEVPKDPLTGPIDTFKEVRKDPIRDPTVKEIRKGPITDTPSTIKELRKDPIQDTRKELAADPTANKGAFDPGPFPGPEPFVNPGLRPFVMDTPHQAQGFGDVAMSGDGLAECAWSIAETIAAIDQDRAVAQEYDQILAMLGGGQA